jgi:hypothetical protein
MTDRLVAHTWADDPDGALHGPGISRPSDAAAARPYRLRVQPRRGAALIVTLHAESERLAVCYAQNRWPDSRITPLT